MRRVSDEARDRVAALREQPFEDQGNLAVSTGDDDAHVAMLRTAILCGEQTQSVPKLRRVGYFCDCGVRSRYSVSRSRSARLSTLP